MKKTANPRHWLRQMPRAGGQHRGGGQRTRRRLRTGKGHRPEAHHGVRCNDDARVGRGRRRQGRRQSADAKGNQTVPRLRNNNRRKVMTGSTTCTCSAAPKLIFPCSGGSDVGAVSDQAARKLTRDGAGKMYCLAGIGGRVTGIMETTKSAARVLAIDGCEQDCARKTLELAGFTQVRPPAVVGFGNGERQDTTERRQRGESCREADGRLLS